MGIEHVWSFVAQLGNAPDATNSAQESSYVEGSCEVHAAAFSSWQAWTMDFVYGLNGSK